MSLISNRYYSASLHDHAMPSSFNLTISKVVIHPSFSFFLVVVYFPPKPTPDMFTAFFDYFYERPDFLTSNMLILGDFNLPEVTDSTFPLHNGSTLARQLADFISFFNLTSHNNVRNNSGRTLDLVLTNFTSDRVTVYREPGLVSEDGHHPPLLIKVFPDSFTPIPFPSYQSSPLYYSYNFSKMDSLGLYDSFKSTDWSVIFSQSDVNSAVNYFYDIVYTTLDKHVPKSADHLNVSRFPSFFSPELRTALRRKDYFQARKDTSTFFKIQFNKFRALAKKLLRQIIQRREYAVFHNAKSNPGQMWKFFGDKRKSLECSGLMKDSEIITDPQVISNEFGAFFNTVYDSSPSSYNIPPEESSASNVFTLGQCSEADVSNAIKNLKTTKTPGPDQIPSFILKACSDSFVGPLTFIFNLAIASSVFPFSFKSSYVCPIPKKGNSIDITNYRPISILSPFSQVFEHIIYNQIYPHVSNSISPYQHGFVRKRSTLTNLMSFTEYIYSAFSSWSQVDVIYLDFEKAFDKIRHDVLLSKLSSFGFHSSVLSFFASYLRDRKQYVRFKGKFSNAFPALSGVPQGSKLGPLLFLLAINDITAVPLHSRLLLFADDLKLFFRISSVADCLLLQADLNAIASWASINHFRINISKSHFMTFSRRKNPLQFAYSVNDSPLSRVLQTKDLGVLFDTKLNFSFHVDSIIKKANQSLGFLLRNTIRLYDINTFKSLYCAFVRSHLEYCCQIWFPNKKASQRIERVQARFVRSLFYRLNGFYPSFPHQISYHQLLFHLDLESLANRRTKQDLKFLHKLLNFSFHTSDLLEMIKLHVPYSRLRTHPRPLFSSSFPSGSNLARITTTFNTFHRELDIFSNANTFQQSVEDILRIVEE